MCRNSCSIKMKREPLPQIKCRLNMQWYYYNKDYIMVKSYMFILKLNVMFCITMAAALQHAYIIQILNQTYQQTTMCMKRSSENLRGSFVSDCINFDKLN